MGMKYEKKVHSCKINGKLKGTTVKFPKIGVGATEQHNVISFGEGKTLLKNCAIELKLKI